MNQLLLKANDFINKVNISWAICGGFALDLFLEKEIRIHSDIDIVCLKKIGKRYSNICYKTIGGYMSFVDKGNCVLWILDQ